MWCRIRDGINTCGAMDPGLRRDDDIEKSQNKKLKNMSSWGPGPARRVAWVDADHGAQVIKLVANATHHLHSKLFKLFTLHSIPCHCERSEAIQ